MERIRRRGFTLIELLVFSVISSLTLVAFITILLVILRIQVRQQAVAEVNQQSQFLMQTIQGYVEQSSLVDATSSVVGNSNAMLHLRMPSSSTNSFVGIYLDNTTHEARLCSTPDSSGNYCNTGYQALTSAKVSVDSLNFTYTTSTRGHTAVGVSFTMSYKTANPKQAFSQFLQFGVARVSAATFDNNILPSSNAAYSVGVSGQSWTDINGVLRFNGSNVGINVIPNTARFQVGGGDLYVDNSDGAGRGIIVKDSGGICWRWRPSAANGAVIAASTTCP